MIKRPSAPMKRCRVEKEGTKSRLLKSIKIAEYQETELVIKKLPTKKSPGSDGFLVNSNKYLTKN